MSDPLRVVVVDDNADIRGLIRLALERDERLELVAEARDGAAGLERIAAYEPDIVLLDLSMPVKDGLEVLGELQQDEEPPVVIVLSGFSSGPPEAKAIEHGAAGYIEKGVPIREMADRIVAIYRSARASV